MQNVERPPLQVPLPDGHGSIPVVVRSLSDSRTRLQRQQNQIQEWTDRRARSHRRPKLAIEKIFLELADLHICRHTQIVGRLALHPKYTLLLLLRWFDQD